MGSADIIAAIEATLKLVAMVGGVGIVLFKMGRISSALEAKLTRQAEILEEQKEETKEVKEEARKINTVLTELAVQNTRLDTLDKRYEEIRNVVFPLPPPVRP